VCVAYRESLKALLGTWKVFAEHALGLLEPGSTSAWSEPAPEHYLIHARLYFGIWFRNKGKRVVSLDKAASLLPQAQEFGSVSYMDTIPEVEFD